MKRTTETLLLLSIIVLAIAALLHSQRHQHYHDRIDEAVNKWTAAQDHTLAEVRRARADLSLQLSRLQQMQRSIDATQQQQSAFRRHLDTLQLDSFLPSNSGRPAPKD